MHWNQVIFGSHTKTKSNSIPRTKTKSISIPAPKRRQFRPPAQKPSSIRPEHWNQVNFHPHTKTMSISMPRHKNQVIFDRCSNQVISDPHTETRSNPIPALRWSQFRCPILKSSQFWPRTKKSSQLQFRHCNRVFRTVNKNQVNFVHPHKKQINSESYTEIRLILISRTEIKWVWTTRKSSEFRCPN